MPTVDVIVPVHGGLSVVRRCLESLWRQPQRTPWELVVVDDASPDPALRAYLDAQAQAQPRLTLLRNAQNLGFAASVNRGMALHPERDVVLLNSDTEVANDWLDRLMACATAEARIATATPFSNNATICSFPRLCKDNPLPLQLSVAAVDAACAHANRGRRVDIPTAVGFCMVIRRGALDEVGSFDEATFGRGYGEENDFCMRAARSGWRHVLCADTFVYHQGGSSFGTEQQERRERAQAILHRRYPDYQHLVRFHVAQDPARPLCLRALAEIVRQAPRPRVLFVTHNLGGGTEKHVAELAAYLRDRMEVLVLRPTAQGGASLAFGAAPDAERFWFEMPEGYTPLLEACRELGVARVHLHHLLGHDTAVQRLALDLRVPLDITLHDYHLVNSHPTLLPASALPPREGEPLPDLRALAIPAAGGEPAERWRARHAPLLVSAARVFAPSRATAELFRAYYPALKPIVAWHPDWERDAPYPPPRARPLGSAEPLRVLVLGAMGREKGADLLEACAGRAARRGDPLEFHLLGTAYWPLRRAVRTHGAYREDDLPARIERLAPHVVWFPTLWPETYSYTLSAVLRAGLPIVAPDFGVFPERLAGRPLTWIEPWHRPGGSWPARFLEVRRALQAAASTPAAEWSAQPLPAGRPFRYAAHYAAALGPPAAPTPDAPLDWVDRLARTPAPAHEGPQTMSERTLVLLLRLRRQPGIREVLRLVPYEAQRRFKRWLSRRPIHELEA